MGPCSAVSKVSACVLLNVRAGLLEGALFTVGGSIWAENSGFL